jgi:hypothetical protein
LFAGRPWVASRCKFRCPEAGTSRRALTHTGAWRIGCGSGR